MAAEIKQPGGKGGSKVNSEAQSRKREERDMEREGSGMGRGIRKWNKSIRQLASLGQPLYRRAGAGEEHAGVPRPELVHKLEGCTDEVNGAVLIPGEHGVISVSSDRSVRVWLLRDSGQFWPSGGSPC
jgi:hypothetical protein